MYVYVYVYVEIVFSKYLTPDHWHDVYTKQRTAAVSNDLCFCWMFVAREHTLEGVLNIAETLLVTERSS
jgi:hypothetical protein